MTIEEIYKALGDDTIDPLTYLTEKEYVLDLKTFRRLVFHPYFYDTYKWHQKITGILNLLEFSVVGTTFRLKE